MTTNFTGYTVGSQAIGPSSAVIQDQEVAGFWTLSKCKRAYQTYLDSKRLEIEEQQQARRYRHGVQWTADQIKTLNDRKQPVVTYNRIGRKIDGIVGLVERLKQDPKAYPRTPRQQQGADLATAVLRYLMDANFWNEKSPLVAEAAAVDGLAGVELDLKLIPPRGVARQSLPPTMPQPNLPVPGPLPPNVVPLFAGSNRLPQVGMVAPPMAPQPDYDIVFRVVDNDGFFYDPRSFKNDFSDARYIGMGKFVDEELLKTLMPQFSDVIGTSGGQLDEMTTNSDRDVRWFQQQGDFRQVRLVDIWYKYERGWRWALFTGQSMLLEGESPFRDEHGSQFPKYIMFSSQIDQDGDRYGFVRNLMSAQDEINQRRSKGLHAANSRRVRATKAAIADGNIEALRREAARPDGVILSNTSLDDLQFDDQAQQAAMMAQMEFMKEAKSEIENFGPNPALIGQASGGIGGSSGRAIALLQQAGIAELGPYMINLRAWKIRVYRALFLAAQAYWTNERWIRVTDTQGAQQFVQINGIQTDPLTGMPRVINPIGELDVDIVVDEGPDSITLMQDTYDAISTALPSVAKMLSPPQVAAAMDVLIETSPLPADVKARFRAASQQPSGPPPEQQAKMAQMQMDQQNAQQKMQLDQQNKQQQIMLDQQGQQKQMELDFARMQQEAEFKRNQMLLDAQTQIAIEREKAMAQIQLQREMAAQQMASQEANGNGISFGDPDIDMRTAHYRNGLVIQQQDNAAKRIDQALTSILENMARSQDLMGQSHQALMAAFSKPRKTLIQRDPTTNRVIGAISVADEGQGS